MAGGQESNAAMARASQWLFDREVRRRGDWSILNPHVEAGGWYFEYRNEFYPDVDDTAMVLMGLARSGFAWQDAGAGDEAIAGKTREVRAHGAHALAAPHRVVKQRGNVHPAVQRG